MKTTRKPLQVKTTSLFSFEKNQSSLFGTTHPTTVTITTSSTGVMTFVKREEPGKD